MHKLQKRIKAYINYKDTTGNMPWTSFKGWYYLRGIEELDDEPHWVVELKDGDTCFVPYDSVRNPDQYFVDLL